MFQIPWHFQVFKTSGHSDAKGTEQLCAQLFPNNNYLDTGNRAYVWAYSYIQHLQLVLDTSKRWQLADRSTAKRLAYSGVPMLSADRQR